MSPKKSKPEDHKHWTLGQGKTPNSVWNMFPRWMRKWSDKKLPHQGEKEMARRRRQIASGFLKQY